MRDNAISSTTPLVSVVIPAYNCARYVEEAIGSALAQDYPALEVVVVEDGSTDATLEKLTQLQDRYPDRVRVFTQPNSGSAVARNRGIREARGEFIAFLDADDIWLPEKIRAQIAYLQSHPDVALVYCDYLEWLPGVDAAELTSERNRGLALDAVDDTQSGWLYPRLLTDCIVWTSSVVARRSLLETIGDFDATLRRGQDYDYWLRASQATRIVKLARVMALYRIVDDSISRRKHAVNYQYEVLKKNLKRWGRRSRDGQTLSLLRLQSRMFETWYHFSTLQYRFGAYGDAMRSALKALVHRPFSLRGWAVLAESALRYPIAALQRGAGANAARPRD